MTLEELLADIRERKSVSAFGVGVASAYVSAMGACLDGAGLCPAEIFKLASADRWQKELADSAGRLVYSDESTVVFEKSIREGADISAGAVLEYDCVLSSRRQDRDRDIVEQKGGLELDPRQPALWQHIQLSPIGKMVRMLEQDENFTKCRYALADTALGRDAATLVKFGALRKSIGFRPSEFAPLEIVKNAEGKNVVRGWHIKKATGLEGSLVSIPANADANILATYAKEFDGVVTAFSRDALREPSVKHWAKGLFDRRPVVVAGASFVDVDVEKNCGTGAGGDDGLLVQKSDCNKPKKCDKCRESGKECDCKDHGEKSPAGELIVKRVEAESVQPISISSHPYPAGSFEAVQQQLRMSAYKHFVTYGVPFVHDSFIDLFATMADSAIFSLQPYGGSHATGRKLYQVSYVAKDGAAVLDGEPKEVDLDVSVVAKAIAEPAGIDPRRLAPENVAMELAAKSLTDRPAAAAVCRLAPIIRTLEMSPAAAQLAGLLGS